MADTEPRQLTPKQKRFVDFYLGECRFNASAAALRAGYSVRQSASDVLSNPVIRARIDAELNKTAATRDEILAELREVAFRGLDDFIEVKHYGDEVAAKMDARAKMTALELLAKAHGLLTENVNLSGDVLVRRYIGVSPEDV